MNMTTSKMFKVMMFFHSLSVFNDRLQQKTLAVSQDLRAGMLVGFYVQRLLKACAELFIKQLFTNFNRATAPVYASQQQYLPPTPIRPFCNVMQRDGAC